MKKIINVISITLLTIIMLFSMSGCVSFIRGNDANTEQPAEQTTPTVNNAVTFNTGSGGELTELNLQQAYEKVKYTAAAISVNLVDGNASAGSGVIADISYVDPALNNDNYLYIITCQHVIDDAKEIEVYLPDDNCRYENNDYIFSGYIGKKDGAVTLIGGDVQSDIAVIRVDLSKPAISGKKLVLANTKLTKARIPENTRVLRVFDEVFAIGNPTGALPGTASAGRIAYLNREVFVGDVGNMNLMQIDVSINPGNSGGGLYNLYGELVGITNAGNESYERICFAVPFTDYTDNDMGYKTVATSLLGTYQENGHYGYVEGRKAKMGFSISKSNDIRDNAVYVIAVEAGSKAAGAGMFVNDKITRINDTVITSYEQATEMFDTFVVGSKVKIRVQHLMQSAYNVYYGNEVELKEIEIAQYIFNGN